jgi:hypothetical protein
VTLIFWTSLKLLSHKKQSHSKNCD